MKLSGLSGTALVIHFGLAHNKKGTHRGVFLWAECGIYTVKMRCQNK